jgi:cobyrinic acid a,c-diamide synthase
MNSSNYMSVSGKDEGLSNTGCRMLISAAHKSSGKTMVSIGLCAALAARGHVVQPFKKGPDYIDPMWLGQAAGRSCRNLDLYLMENDDVVATFARHASEVNLIEGNKGLYDGLALDGSNSNAALAKLLGLPVMLVIDARGMTRGIAPLILGYQAFDRDINIAGVILNNLGGSRHESKLRAVIEHYTDVPVIGAIHHDERLSIVERHLGLMPSNESHVATAKIKQIGEAIAEQVDLDKLLQLSQTAPLNIPHKAQVSALPCGEKFVSASRAIARLAFTMQMIWMRSKRMALNLCRSIPCVIQACRKWMRCILAAVFPRPVQRNSKRTVRFVPISGSPSNPACRLMPSAAG